VKKVDDKWEDFKTVSVTFMARKTYIQQYIFIISPDISIVHFLGQTTLIL